MSLEASKPVECGAALEGAFPLLRLPSDILALVIAAVPGGDLAATVLSCTALRDAWRSTPGPQARAPTA